MDIRIKELFDEGVRLSVQEHAEQEAKKVGILRAGNTGIAAVDEGSGKLEIAGKCHRQTYLRLIGVASEDADYSRELMFDSGRSNEDLWVAVLQRSYKGIILREEEIPIQWTTKSGIPVSGRPDIVLCDNDKKPLRGLELKLVSSMWTARDILMGRPKGLHVMQAGHYMWKLGVPFELWYTSRVDWSVLGWAQKHYPRYGEPGSEHCEYDDNGLIRKVIPFTQGFHLRFGEKGLIEYTPVGQEDEPWKETIVSAERIEAYYEYVAQIGQTKNLGPRPQNLSSTGEKQNWKFCDYCPLKPTCDAHESDFDTWLEAAKGIVPKAE